PLGVSDAGFSLLVGIGAHRSRHAEGKTGDGSDARGRVEEAARRQVVDPGEVSPPGVVDGVEAQALASHRLAGASPVDRQSLAFGRELISVLAPIVATAEGARLGGEGLDGGEAAASLGLAPGMGHAEGDEVGARAVLEPLAAEQRAGALGLRDLALVA